MPVWLESVTEISGATVIIVMFIVSIMNTIVYTFNKQVVTLCANVLKN